MVARFVMQTTSFRVVGLIALLASTVSLAWAEVTMPIHDAGPPSRLAAVTTPDAATQCADGTIPYFTTIRVGIEPYHSLEVDGKLFTGCNYLVLTGLGGRINHDSNWAGLVLKGRYVYPDGTMSAQAEQYFGDLGAGPERQAEVPYGHAVIGLGVGQEGTHDLKTIVLRYRKVEVVNGVLRLVGPVGTVTVGSGKLDPSASYTLSQDDKVLIGAGFYDAVERTKTIALHVGLLNNQGPTPSPSPSPRPTPSDPCYPEGTRPDICPVRADDR